MSASAVELFDKGRIEEFARRDRALSCRGRGLARRVVSRLLASLQEDVDCIGLNVKAENRAAIACYERLGFQEIAEYAEFMLEPR